MSLFRREAIEHQQRRLFGETTIHLPVSLVTASLLGVALCVGFLVLLSLTPFPRKEVVSGRLEPAAGLAEVTQPVGTTVVSVEVAMGDLVEKGTLLARLEEDLSNEEGRTAGLEAANLQSRRLEARRQFESTLASYRLQERGYLDRAEAADAEVAAGCPRPRTTRADTGAARAGVCLPDRGGPEGGFRPPGRGCAP
jgi:membrane fusion protein